MQATSSFLGKAGDEVLGNRSNWATQREKMQRHYNWTVSDAPMTFSSYFKDWLLKEHSLCDSIRYRNSCSVFNLCMRKHRRQKLWINITKIISFYSRVPQSVSLTKIQWLAQRIKRCLTPTQLQENSWKPYFSADGFKLVFMIANNDGSRRCISSHNFDFSQNIEKIARPFGRRYPGDCLVSRNKCAELNGKPGSKESSKNLWPLMTGFRVMEIPINCFFLFLFLFCHGYTKRRNDYWICKFINNSVVKKWTSNHVPNY